ncbi:MAG TPA: bifunctional diguanylate cyclase/phosphodiesterase [Desulfobulbaceae bacterium]|nr:bifunctional diguanylate cyclase/phosphodiesterase [Desulfobulbaceae bacterium]
MKDKTSFLPQRLSLKIFIFSSLLGVSVITFFLIFLITTTTFQKAYIKQSNDISQAISSQITASLLQLMKKGWSMRELEHFIQPFISANHDIPLKVTIYCSDPVKQLFGTIDTDVPDVVTDKVMQSGESVSIEEKYSIRQVTAIKAKEKCLSCHINVSVGEVMGVLDIYQDIGPVISKIYKKFLILFLLLSPLPFIVAVLISRYSSKKIENSTTLLQNNIKGINSVQDLTTFERSSDRTDFVELNHILSEFNLLADKIKDIAIDKKLLEFEVSLLEKFIITTEVVRDWKEHVSNLLIQVNTIMDAYALFTIFKVGEETYDLEIFWLGKPSPQTKKRFDDIVRKRIAEDPRVHFLTSITVNHNIADYLAPEIDIEEKSIDLQIKSIFLESPQIGGVVGIGLQSIDSRDDGRSLVIEGILTTLINVVGSVKAIDKYTKDVEYYVTRDPLTNLYNQRVFWELAGNELVRTKRRNHKFAILVIDLDNFKMINDRYGHVFGDSFLQFFARQIQDVLRDGDILTRYGGDKFAAILPEADMDQAHAGAMRVLNALKEVVIDAPDRTKLKATVSIGLAIFPDHSKDVNSLFTIADNLMSKAKKAGKNRVGIPTDADIKEALRAMEERSLFILNLLENAEKIIPLFQPIMSIHDNSIHMHELLMGIRHEGKILPASSFIETAEKMGIISQLDFIVMGKAFKEVRKKNYQGKLFVNLSPSSLILSEYINNVKQLAADNKISPSQIVFEITEREAVSNRVLLEKFSRDLKNEGFKFAIDDFGSGFSTFQYLKLFPVDFIKIEGEFIINSPKKHMDKIFVKNIISLARDLKIKTIAEHIETVEILQMAQELGADYAQGYYIRKPGLEIQ